MATAAQERAEILAGIAAINKRLDKINGTITKHGEWLSKQHARLAVLEAKEVGHSVNWDRIITFVLSILNAVILAKLLTA